MPKGIGYPKDIPKEKFKTILERLKKGVGPGKKEYRYNGNGKARSRNVS